MIDESGRFHRHVGGVGIAAALILASAFFVSCGTLPPPAEKFSEGEILLKRGDGYYFNSRYEEAIEEYTRAIAADPGLAAAYRYRASAFLALEENVQALADYDRALEIDPSFAEAHLGRGVLHYRQGAYSEAIDDFDRVIDLDPWNSSARYYKARACEKVGRLREAVEAYRGYIHCTVPRDDGTVEFARERIRELEKGPLR